MALAPSTAPPVSGDTATLTARVGHAYLTNYGKGHGDGSLVQFDIKDGMVVSPGRTLVRGLHEPLGVAVAPDGLVHIAESQYQWRAIDAYQVTGGSAKLVRKITFSRDINGPEPERLAVDHQGYLYSSMDNENIAVFQPGVHGYVQNPHYLYNTGGAFQIGVDRLGDVYQPGGDHSYLHLGRPGKFAHPRTRAVIPRGKEWNYGTVFIMRAEGDQLFFGAGPYNGVGIVVGVIPIHQWGRVKASRNLVLEGGCSRGISRIITGFSYQIANGYLYETCAYVTPGNRLIRGIWTYAADGPNYGIVHPLHFASAPIWQPGDIAIGP